LSLISFFRGEFAARPFGTRNTIGGNRKCRLSAAGRTPVLSKIPTEVAAAVAATQTAPVDFARAASMANIFISYSKQDRANARMLAALLEANGYTVWWDTSLVGGDQFREKIASELAKARAVIAIWTKNSVSSLWVQSEAGRALADHKLIPVRSPDIEYNEIPPPFESVHTPALDQTEQILAAVAAQLAKPASPGPRWKVLQYQILTWLGLIGGAITLTTNISGVLKLSAALSWVLSNWSALLKHFWQAFFFFKMKVSPFDAALLTMALLMTTAIFHASHQSGKVAQKSLTVFTQSTRAARFFFGSLPFVSLSAALCVVLIVLLAGTLTLDQLEEIRLEKKWDRLIELVYGSSGECSKNMKNEVRNRTGGRSIGPLNAQVLHCFESASTNGLDQPDRDTFATFPPVFIDPRGSVWLSALEQMRPQGNALQVTSFLAFMSLPIFLPFVLYFVVRCFFSVQLQVFALSRRLWRTLFLFGGILLLNSVVVKLERWFEAIFG
jgi:hypothetical protein